MSTFATSPADGNPAAGNKRRRNNADPIVAISKEMSKLLRHNPPPGAMDAQGWVALPVLLKHLKSRPSEQQVREVVGSNDKKRFVLDDSTDPPRIRAAQGHSVELEQPILQPVEDPSIIPVAVHLTSKDSWAAIQGSGELRRMKRTHIHFATQPHLARANTWANIILQLDLQAAMQAGHQFFLSDNHVLLCEGPLPVTYVREVAREDLPEAWRQQHKGQQGQGQGAGKGQNMAQGQKQEKGQQQGQQQANAGTSIDDASTSRAANTDQAGPGGSAAWEDASCHGEQAQPAAPLPEATGAASEGAAGSQQVEPGATGSA